jgi:hypothetical protein
MIDLWENGDVPLNSMTYNYWVDVYCYIRRRIVVASNLSSAERNKWLGLFRKFTSYLKQPYAVRTFTSRLDLWLSPLFGWYVERILRKCRLWNFFT